MVVAVVRGEWLVVLVVSKGDGRRWVIGGDGGGKWWWRQSEMGGRKWWYEIVVVDSYWSNVYVYWWYTSRILYICNISFIRSRYMTNLSYLNSNTKLSSLTSLSSYYFFFLLVGIEKNKRVVYLACIFFFRYNGKFILHVIYLN